MTATIFERSAAFSAAECDGIVALAASFPSQPGSVLGAGGYAPDPRVRDVVTTYLPRTETTQWLYDRLDALFAEAAAALDIGVAPIVEPPQLVRYEIGSHFIAWHTDGGADLYDARMVSASIELSDPEAYEGGTLEIVQPRAETSRTFTRGSATLFLSRLLHRVTPVTRGVRLALVVWAGAPSARA